MRGLIVAFLRAGRTLQAVSRLDAGLQIEQSRRILASRKRVLFLAVLPVLLAILLPAADAADLLPEKIPVLGGSKAYIPALIDGRMFFGSIFVGLIAGLITGVIGAGGGYILTPALMSFGVRGIMAVGTDQFHLFAKAIMGTAIHRKLGNVNLRLAAWFVAGSLAGVTAGGQINRAVFNRSPALSDALISSVYVLVLGVLGAYAIADWRRLAGRKGEAASELEATTDFARRLQALALRPRIRFDETIVPGGRSIAVYPVILCGLVVGFVASIMGVGGGFLTFPMFVYGLGVSTFTTVGTDILQIIFTTSYSSIFQYAIHGFVFYSVAVGMLLGSLGGVQVGAMVTRMVKGSQIRAFYALTILAGFSNRLFALPRKLADLGYLSVSRAASVAAETVGTVIFFATVGIFALWILLAFFRKVGGVRERAGRPNRLVVEPKRFAVGAAGLAVFIALLAAGLSPARQGRALLARADSLFNQLAKDAAYCIPGALAESERFAGTTIDLGVRPREMVDSGKLAAVLRANGLEADLLGDGRTRVRGGLGSLARAALADAQLGFDNRDGELERRYGLRGPQVLYSWWVVFDGLARRYTQENRGPEASFCKLLTTRVFEPAYNFRGIEPQPIARRLPAVILLLGLYVLYTLWYGCSILLLFEGLGIRASAAGQKKET